MTYEDMVNELCIQPEEILKGKSYWFLSSSKKDGSSSSQWMQKGMMRGNRNLTCSVLW